MTTYTSTEVALRSRMDEARPAAARWALEITPDDWHAIVLALRRFEPRYGEGETNKLIRNLVLDIESEIVAHLPE